MGRRDFISAVFFVLGLIMFISSQKDCPHSQPIYMTQRTPSGTAEHSSNYDERETLDSGDSKKTSAQLPPPPVVKKRVKHAADLKRCMNPQYPMDFSMVRLTMSGVPGGIACYGQLDVVCRTIRDTKIWEGGIRKTLIGALQHVQTVSGRPPIFIDIGGNVGSMSIPLSVLNFETHTFEMLPSNIQLLHTSRCLNSVQGKMTIHHTGLGETNKQCFMLSTDGNLGDTAIECGNRPDPDSQYKVRGEVSIQRLDDLVKSTGIEEKMDEGRIPIVKIDVEGFEINVMDGAKNFLSHRNKPPLVFSEVWKIRNLTRYAEIMVGHGYCGYAASTRGWIMSVEQGAHYHKNVPVDIDDVAWVAKEHVERFKAIIGAKK